MNVFLKEYYKKSDNIPLIKQKSIYNDIKKGYYIHVISGYQFDKSENLFNSYVKDLYKIKSTTKDDIFKSITKSFLNNLLGRWGLDINKYITKFVSVNEFELIRLTRKIRSF